MSEAAAGASLFDPGLQPERTALSWRRTALSVAVGSLVALRVLPGALGDWIWYAPGLLGIVFACWLWWVSEFRYRVFTRHHLGDGALLAPGGSTLIAMASIVTAIGVTALTAVALTLLE